MKTVDDMTSSNALAEMVIYEGETGKNYHQNLFSLKNECYLAAGDNMLDSIISVQKEHVGRLHISAGWETILQVALWTHGVPAVHEVLALIRRSGLTDTELEPFRRSEVSDIFPWLYYSKRFDILRKICNLAKAKAESKCGIKTLRIYCHIVSDEMGKIVASSL